MSNVPADLKYTKSHEWIQDLGDGTVNIGITDHAQTLLGDLVFVELPEVDSEVSAGDECAVVESVKAASDVYSPLSGTVIAVNEVLADTPETINQDAYGDGWLIKLKLSDANELTDLLDANAYEEVAAEDH
ncbi:MAG: glycine cleavage system protein GcvH [Gammaproteobacteria bacterium]|nr:glycine cleavage system protein GcvH [Gammaproteobacteria bacterium]MDH5593398.1 glycine cleavage system protein GcvH [Gammaproteobacteria bacterium]MDH5613400.1 glycine cleavage system protein GcvH [Gammaproteobacteria bacterium]